MSFDRTDIQSHLPTSNGDRPIEVGHGYDAAAPVVGQELPRTIDPDASTDTVEALLLSVGRGNQEAFIALKSRMAGLVRANVCRVLCDASRSDEITQETFAEVFEDAAHFDPHRDSAQTWLLTRAHQHALEGLPYANGTGDAQAPKLDQSAPALRP